MIKSIIKEMFILILLCIAIVLTLGVLFYDYIPTSKIIPSAISYTTPSNIREELEQVIVEEGTQKVIKTYEIEDVDLRLYQSSGSYNKGKSNPFSPYTNPATTSPTNTTGTNTINTNTVQQNSVDTNTVGKFFDNKGNK